MQDPANTALLIKDVHHQLAIFKDGRIWSADNKGTYTHLVLQKIAKSKTFFFPGGRCHTALSECFYDIFADLFYWFLVV